MTVNNFITFCRDFKLIEFFEAVNEVKEVD